MPHFSICAAALELLRMWCAARYANAAAAAAAAAAMMRLGDRGTQRRLRERRVVLCF